jgi:hypothetical protein
MRSRDLFGPGSGMEKILEKFESGIRYRINIPDPQHRFRILVSSVILNYGSGKIINYGSTGAFWKLL